MKERPLKGTLQKDSHTKYPHRIKLVKDIFWFVGSEASVLNYVF